LHRRRADSGIATDKGRPALIAMNILAFRLEPAQKNEPEGRLIKAVKRRDRAAFDALVVMHDPDLTRFVARRVQADSVDDVRQEAWLAAWRSIHRFDGRCQFRTWLFGIALKKVQDYYRTLAREQMRLPSSLVTENLDYQDPSFARAELRESLKAAIASLTDVQRELILLYYESDLTLPEIAKLLDRNLNTVKYQFYRAHAHVAASFDQSGSSEVLLGGKR